MEKTIFVPKGDDVTENVGKMRGMVLNRILEK
jgi:hypothetical protein